jgi:hypothetical protein
MILIIGCAILLSSEIEFIDILDVMLRGRGGNKLDRAAGGSFER